MTDHESLAGELEALAERVPKSLGYVLQSELCSGFTDAATALREQAARIAELESEQGDLCTIAHMQGASQQESRIRELQSQLARLRKAIEKHKETMEACQQSPFAPADTELYDVLKEGE